MLNYWFAHEEVIRLSIHNAIASSVEVDTRRQWRQSEIVLRSGKGIDAQTAVIGVLEAVHEDEVAVERGHLLLR